MQLTKFSHSCVRFDDGANTLVVDPGVWSEASTALAGAGGVLITHEHPDHVDVEAITTALRAQPGLPIWAPEAVGAAFPALADAITPVTAGQEFEAAGFSVRAFGGQHALIHSSVPVVSNIGYLINGTVYHPGDSLVVPAEPVDTLLVPIHAPWSAIKEVLDFEIAVRARRAYQIHDALLSDVGITAVSGHVRRIAGEYGTDFELLGVEQSVDA